MPDKWTIGDKNELEMEKCELIKTIRGSPYGNDPKVVEILDELETEYVVEKHYELLGKLVWLLRDMMELKGDE